MGMVKKLFGEPKPPQGCCLDGNNRCTKYRANSGPDVGRTLMPLGSAHFCHAEKAVKYSLTVLGVLSWMMIPGIDLAKDHISGWQLCLRSLRVGPAGPLQMPGRIPLLFG